MADGGWLSVHTYYHADADPLLVEAVSPLVRQLAAADLADDFFFLRYWDGGTHLRLRVRPKDPTARPEVQERVTGALRAYLDRRPCPTLITAAEYARTVARRATTELVATAPEPLRPNNSVMVRAYRREHAKYGYGESMEAVERHFVESSRLALEVVCQGDPRARRATTACALILAAWLHGGCGPPERAYLAEPDDLVTADKVARVASLARRIRTLSPPEPVEAASTALATWMASIAVLRATLDTVPSPDASAVTDICAHLVCNRLGIDLGTERFLRRVAWRALSSL